MGTHHFVTDEGEVPLNDVAILDISRSDGELSMGDLFPITLFLNRPVPIAHLLYQ